MDMGRGEERVRCMARVTWKLTLSCVTQIVNRNLQYVSKPKQGLCIKLNGWDREGDRMEFKKGRDICIQTPGVGVGQGGLACCNSWGRKESDMTERLILSYLMADSC